MKKFIFSFIVAGLLLLPAFVFGAINYSRIPTGKVIQNPVNFDIYFDNLSEFCAYLGQAVTWGLMYVGEATTTRSTLIGIPPSENVSHTFTENLPLGNYTIVDIGCFNVNGELLEGSVTLEAGTPAFKIIPKIFTLPSTAIASSTDFIGSLIGAIGPFIWLFIGIPLAFVVIKRVIKIVPRK